MRLLLAQWQLFRMLRARWHRRQQERLIDLVADYLEAIRHD